MTERILTMPRLGETMEEGKIVGFLVKPGESFKRGDSIIEIETDKTVAEFPALGDGTIIEWIGAIGDQVVVGDPLARVDIGGGPDWIAENGETSEKEIPSPAAEASAKQIINLDMPRLGETMEEGRIVRWLIAAGDEFVRGEAILEIETDKTVAEFPALVSGKLVETLREEGDMVMVGHAIGRIEVATSSAPQKAQVDPHLQVDTLPVPATARPSQTSSQSTRKRATPLARRLARQKGIDISNLSGSGRRGRIEKEDVLAASGTSLTDADVGFVELAGGRVAYSDSGPKSARAFLLLHGFSGDRTTWSLVANGLRKAGFRVIAPDLPAHGLTTINANDVQQLSAFLPAFLDALSIEQVDVAAHSLGAVVAADFASSHPARVKNLTLLAPAGLGSEIDAGFVQGMAHAKSAGEVAHLLRRIAAKPVELSSALLADLAATMATGRLKDLADAIVGPTGQRVEIVAAIDKLSRSLPVRVLVGLQDRIIPWQQVTVLPPSTGVHFLAQSGHMPQWDQAKEVIELLSKLAGDSNE